MFVCIYSQQFFTCGAPVQFVQWKIKIPQNGNKQKLKVISIHNDQQRMIVLLLLSLIFFSKTERGMDSQYNEETSVALTLTDYCIYLCQPKFNLCSQKQCQMMNLK